MLAALIHPINPSRIMDGGDGRFQLTRATRLPSTLRASVKGFGERYAVGAPAAWLVDFRRRVAYTPMDYVLVSFTRMGAGVDESDRDCFRRNPAQHHEFGLARIHVSRRCRLQQLRDAEKQGPTIDRATQRMADHH